MNPLKKFCGICLIVVSFFLLSPTKTHAQYVDIPQSVKEFVADPIFYNIAQVLIHKLTAQTLNYINSGFDGNPAYVTDPNQFFLDVGDNVVSHYLSTNGGLNQLCSPFRAQVRLALVKNYLQEPLYSCTLGALEQNYNAFTNDFSQGGWDSWFNVTQNNSNNPYGAYLEAQNQLAYEIATAKQNKRDQLQQGSGFLSVERCTKHAAPSDQGPVESGLLQSRTTVSGSGELLGQNEGDCIQKEITTPGKFLSDGLSKVMGAGTDRLISADEIDELVGALLTQAISKGLGGLRNLTQPSSGQKSFSDQLRDELAKKPSNPNAGYDVTGGQVTCTTEPGAVNLDGSTSGGGTNCTQTPVTFPPVVINDETEVGSGSGSGPGTVDPSQEPASLLGDVQAERAKYGAHLTSAEFGRLLTNVASKNSGAGWGVLSKTAGHKCSSSQGDIACDILFHGPSCLIYDVLIGADENTGPATPTWGFAGSANRSNWRGSGSAGSGPCVQVTPPAGGSGSPTGGSGTGGTGSTGGTTEGTARNVGNGDDIYLPFIPRVSGSESNNQAAPIAGGNGNNFCPNNVVRNAVIRGIEMSGPASARTNFISCLSYCKSVNANACNYAVDPGNTTVRYCTAIISGSNGLSVQNPYYNWSYVLPQIFACPL